MSVIETAYQELAELSPLSKRMEIAGSIRRNKAEPKDVVLIPKNEQCKRRIMAYAKMHKTGNIGHGSHHLSYITDGVEIELYFTSDEDWGAMLMYATGTNQYNIMMRTYAKFKGMKLSQHGLFRDGKMIVGETEEEIYAALGKKWKPPKKEDCSWKSRGMVLVKP
jgi:DNA polymerase (family 10)